MRESRAVSIGRGGRRRFCGSRDLEVRQLLWITKIAVTAAVFLARPQVCSRCRRSFSPSSHCWWLQPVIAVGFAVAADSAIRPIAADFALSCGGMRFRKLPRFRRRARAGRRPRDDLPGSLVRVGGVPRVGNPRLALPPGVRCELEPLDTYAGGPCGGACWHRAEGGTLMRVLVVDALALVLYVVVSLPATDRRWRARVAGTWRWGGSARARSPAYRFRWSSSGELDAPCARRGGCCSMLRWCSPWWSLSLSGLMESGVVLPDLRPLCRRATTSGGLCMPPPPRCFSRFLLCMGRSTSVRCGV